MRSCPGVSLPPPAEFLRLGIPVCLEQQDRIELRICYLRSYDTFNFRVSAVPVRNWSGDRAYCGVSYLRNLALDWCASVMTFMINLDYTVMV